MCSCHSRRLLLVILLAGLCSLLHAAPIDQGTLAVSGTWKPEATHAIPALKWVKRGERMRLTFPKFTSGEFGMTCKEPLPAGDWTADFWFVQYTPYCNSSDASITVMLGKVDSPGGPLVISIDPLGSRSNTRVETVEYIDKRLTLNTGDYAGKPGERVPRSKIIGGGYINSGGGFIHWLRLVYQAREKHVIAYLNGEELKIDAPNYTPPVTPVIVRAELPSMLNHDYPLELAGYTVTPEARLLSEGASGRTQQGWSTKPVALTVPMTQTMAQAINAPSLTDHGRSCLQIARLLAARGGTPDDRAAAWNDARAFLEPLITKDPASAAPLLVTMLSTASDEQRPMLAPLIKSYETCVNKLMGRGTIAMPRLVSHLTLIDPVQAYGMVAQRNEMENILPNIFDDLSESNASLALCNICQHFGTDTRPPTRYIQFLPQLRAASPNYYRLVLDNLHEMVHGNFFRTAELEGAKLSFFAWRLAPIDFPTAATLCAGIADPEIRQDTWQGITEALGGQPASGADDQIEAMLLEDIAQFAPTKGASPGRVMMRLARWYESKGRHGEAMRVLEQVKKHLAATPQTAFADTCAIYSFLREIKSPDAAGWLTKATAMVPKNEDDLEEGNIDWQQAGDAPALLGDLARGGRVDDALAIAERLKFRADDTLYTEAIMSVVSTLADTDLPRALTVLRKNTDARGWQLSIANLAKRLAARDANAALTALKGTNDPDLQASLTDELAPALAKTDPKTALALIMKLPVARRATVLIAICSGLPAENPAFTTPCGEAGKARLADLHAKPGIERERLLNSLEALPVRTLVAMQPAFSAEMDAYARVLCAAVARESGLGDDPLWQRLALAEKQKLNLRSYWVCTRLRDALRQWKQEQENPVEDEQ